MASKKNLTSRRTRSASKIKPTRTSSPSGSRSQRPAYIVGMGGSAGALEAFGQFFSHMPSNSGVAFVLVPHLDPTHKGMMPEYPHAIDQHAGR